MAERRMFAKAIVLSDAFLDMPLSARCLYFTLGMLADDDGFVGNPKSIIRQCGATQDDMLILLQKRFLLTFDSGIIVIKHWRINNYLRNDRHTETNYKEELEQLMLNENNAYTERKDVGIPPVNQVVGKWYTEDSIDKDSIDKVSIGEGSKLQVQDNKQKEKQNNNILYGIYKNVSLTPAQLAELKTKCPVWEHYIERLSSYMNFSKKDYDGLHLEKMLEWYNEDKAKGKAPAPQTQASYNIDDYKQASVYERPVYKRKPK